MLTFALRHSNSDNSKLWTSSVFSLMRIAYSLPSHASAVGLHTPHCWSDALYSVAKKNTSPALSGTRIEIS